jgi:hypothetical protein
MTWLALDAPPITLIHPQDRPLALAVMGLLRYRLAQPGAGPRRASGAATDGYERLLRRLLDLADGDPPLITAENRDRVISGVWGLLNQIDDRRQAEMLALYHGLAVEPTQPLTYAQAGSVYDLTAAQARRLCQRAVVNLRANGGLAALRERLADA